MLASFTLMKQVLSLFGYTINLNETECNVLKTILN